MIKTPIDSIEGTLSCLSCLGFLEAEKPLTLKCVHSICADCYNKHGDGGNSKDTIIFCEECKLETKNKELIKENKVIKNLVQRFIQ